MEDTAELERILKDTHKIVDEGLNNEEGKEETLPRALGREETIHRLGDQKEGKEDKEKRETLIRLAEDGYLDKSVVYIKKASKKAIDKLYTEYERKRMRKANEFITDSIISKFAGVLGGLDAIESPEELFKELGKDELLKRDVYHIVETLSPYIPFVGFLSGGITTAKHIYNHRSVEKSDKADA